MKVDRLVTMANDIGQFFAGEPDPAEAVAGTLNHLRRFWDPRMRKQILEYALRDGGALQEPARSAVLALAQGDRSPAA
ncbi:formate dehydrogenase subunit delta [Panacagrimonas sp.]|uniref:formate dehydrogenase subunit delta n=1 Tax=Panacagrimonas sp. TaxID=2480088 RepID=UPI003B526E4C